MAAASQGVLFFQPSMTHYPSVKGWKVTNVTLQLRKGEEIGCELLIDQDLHRSTEHCFTLELGKQ